MRKFIFIKGVFFIKENRMCTFHGYCFQFKEWKMFVTCKIIWKHVQICSMMGTEWWDNVERTWNSRQRIEWRATGFVQCDGVRWNEKVWYDTSNVWRWEWELSSNWERGILHIFLSRLNLFLCVSFDKKKSLDKLFKSGAFPRHQ